MNLNKMTIEDVQVSGKKVLVRCDFNVPLDAEGNITDETRINAALPTIRYLLDNGAAVILCSHLGRPKGEYNMKYSLAPVAKRLSEKLGFEVKLAKDVVGPDAKKLAAEVEPGKAVLLENVRFEPGEEKEVTLTAIGGTRRVFGLNDLTCAQVSEVTKAASLEKAKQKGFVE